MVAAPTPAKTWGPFTGRQLTTIIVALVIGVIAAPSAVWAVDTFSNVAIEDPVSGVKAQIDSARRLQTNAVPRPPATPWSLSIDLDPSNPSPTVIAGPSTTPINLTSVSIGYKATGTADLYVFFWSVPSSATTCSPTNFQGTMYHLPGLASSAGIVTASLPTPLQLRPPVGQKACMYAQTNGTGTITVNFVGYTGS
jgi:hypothetical protein